jgi:hypothetical protein
MAGLHPKAPGQGSNNESKPLQFGDMMERNTLLILQEWQLGLGTDKGTSTRKTFAHLKMHFSLGNLKRLPNYLIQCSKVKMGL